MSANNTVTEINKAQRAGVKAFNNGKDRAPALNQAFLKEACSSKINTIALLDAYLHGWDIANLANGETNQDLPSVIELKRILSF